MSLSPGKYCLRNSRVLFEQWGGAPSCWNTTVFISMPLFLLNAGTNFLRIISMYRSALTVTRFPSLSSKMYGPKIPLLPIAHHTVTFSWLNGRWVCQMKMSFVTKQNQAKIIWVVLNSFTDGLTKFTPFFLIDISLFLENLHFVWKQL